MRMPRTLMILTLGFGVALMTGCENTTPKPEVRSEVEGAVETYLQALTRAYSSLNVEPIENLASEAEVQDVRKLLRGLAASGDRVEARLRSVDFKSVDVFREVNATVTTTEVWDVTRFDAFTGREKGRNTDSIQDSIIQLRLIDGRWMITARRVIGQETGSRWNVDDWKNQSPEDE